MVIKVGLKICIDAGHGGHDSGAIGLTKEKDENLKLAKEIKKRLEQHGVEVVMTRETDVFISLNERVKIANRNNVDGFYSIHFNSAGNVKAKGFENFHYYNSSGGKRIAKHLYDTIINKNITLSNRGVKQAGYYVIKNTVMNACLIEVAFISNNTDMRNYSKHFYDFVEGIAQGILENHGIKYVPITPFEEKETEEVSSTTNLVLLGEELEVAGEIIDGKTYVDIDTVIFDDVLVDGDGKRKVQNNVKLGLVEILESCGFTVGWDNINKTAVAGLSRGEKPKSDYVDVVLLGENVRIKSKMIDNSNYIKIGDYLISLRGFFEKIGLKVVWDSNSKTITITK